VLAIAVVAAAVSIVLLSVVLVRARAAERRYRSLLEHLPQTSVTLFDHSLRLRLVVAGEGGDPPEAQGRRLEEVVSGEQGEVLAGHYAAALEGESRSLEYVSVRDGRDYWLRVVPVREDGRIVGGMAVSQDITDRKRAERAQALAEDRRQLMIDAMNEAYVAIDSRGLITDWNESATKTFGYTREEAIGRPARGLIAPEADQDEIDSLIERFTRGERRGDRLDLRRERAARHKDGHLFTVELAATSHEHRGEVFLHTFMHDITERKLAEADARARAAAVEALAEATGSLARSTTPEDARGSICRAAATIAGADVAILFEPDSHGRGLRATAAIGLAADDEMLPFAGAPSGAVRAFTTREPLFVPDLSENVGLKESIVRRTGRGSALWVPVRHAELPLGVIAVAWSEPLPELPEQVSQMMTLVAADAAVAIERASLLDRLGRMASTDDLTDLPNRRTWSLELAREVARARRSGEPLTVAMVDLDHFKDYNDRHGHQAGDRLLKEAAAAWREALRESDLLARYGGEEFAVALPNCDGEAAVALVERLRAVTPGGESCSAGLATWDGRETLDALVGRADALLYEAKQGGRDRIVGG
jgi:diguanylate cyclase (GGDEF)-like protein/PAS domain S-box-containing protein